MSWTSIKEILEIGYYFSGIALVVGLYFALKQIRIGFSQINIGIEQLNLMKKDMADRSRRASVEKSVEYLKMYATRFIPGFSEYNKKFYEEVPIPRSTDHLFDGKFNISLESLDKIYAVELIIRQNAGLTSLINEIEFFSAAIVEGLAVDDMIFTPVAKHFCRTIEKEHLFISVQRNRGAPFKYTIELYKKWSDRLEIEKLNLEAENHELQKQEIEHKIKAKGTGYRSTPPIGFDS